MAALAVLLKGEGCAVTGCDLKATGRTAWLEAQGIPVSIGHDAAHVADADIVVATPAVARDNPEFAAAEAAGKVRWRGDVLAELVARRDAVAVCGSHGKTTTATFTAKLLKALGEDVAWAIGGETGDFPVAGVGAGPLVVEADESDGTLARYRARLLVVTNCEYDHPDHFPTEADYFACYDAARANAGDVIEAERLPPDDWDIPVRGDHNRRNARAAIEVALRRGHSREAIAAALPSVVAALPDRRFQRLAEGVYTDYAHHPTEMKCAVAMAREACAGTLRVLFQPHRYSRTKALLADFPAAFAGADEVILCPTYAAFEPPVEGGDVADLYAAVRAARVVPRVYLARSCEEAWFHARRERREGDVTLLLGAGDIIDLAPLAASDAPPPVRRHWIGAGSNTWVSDLATGEVYERTTGPAGRPGATLGIPWMAGIPGTIGGWVKMNAGAFGHSISEVVRRVKVDGRWIDKADCGFGYRTSAIEGEIQDVEFAEPFTINRLTDLRLHCRNESNEPMQSRIGNRLIENGDYLARRKKFPPGTKGSVFKNPPGDYAGRLLEAAGCKGLRVGGASVWANHANVIVSGAGATASDFLALAQMCRARVRHRFGVVLDYEVVGLEG